MAMLLARPPVLLRQLLVVVVCCLLVLAASTDVQRVRHHLRSQRNNRRRGDGDPCFAEEAINLQNGNKPKGQCGKHVPGGSFCGQPDRPGFWYDDPATCGAPDQGFGCCQSNDFFLVPREPTDDVPFCKNSPGVPEDSYYGLCGDPEKFDCSFGVFKEWGCHHVDPQSWCCSQPTPRKEGGLAALIEKVDITNLVPCNKPAESTFDGIAYCIGPDLLCTGGDVFIAQSQDATLCPAASSGCCQMGVGTLERKGGKKWQVDAHTGHK